MDKSQNIYYYAKVGCKYYNNWINKYNGKKTSIFSVYNYDGTIVYNIDELQQQN